MKSLYRLWAASLLLSTNYLYAQDNGSNTLPQVTVTATTTKVPEQVWKNFAKYFPTAENPKWYALQDGFFVKYRIVEEANQSVFTKKGELVYTLTYGYESNLPRDIRQEVKSRYFDYQIKGITKLSQFDKVVYLVHLEGDRNFITLRLDDVDMEEIQKLTKS
jgi:hypothetical protein